ncbi:restriction endonuclease [Dictyobacter kobayashii]|uniref:Restriction endonuclease n=1 Tax=Dictyobacter kobayashii TaxID=2014872 RepID=A0A402AW98_9CHLR|nr:restriction endonuclease [Dictyobacter kobayashii]GCE23402.1 restriction endonuclease [Dictyobacter kobayashii]
MARKNSLINTRARIQKEAARKQKAQQLTQTQAAKAAEKARKAYENAQKADQKERARLYTESRIAQVNLQNEQLEQVIASFNNLLADALKIDSFIMWETLKQPLNLPTFNPGQLAIPEQPPVPQNYRPPELSGLQKIFPGAKEKYAQEVIKAQELYNRHVSEHAAREQMRQKKLAEMRNAFEQHYNDELQKIKNQHTEIDNFRRDFDARVPSAIVNYFTMVLATSNYPDKFPQHAKVAYVPESTQLVVEYDFPNFEIIPEAGIFKYVKTKDEITNTIRPLPQRKTLYNSIIAQTTLRTLYELFKADRGHCVDTIVFNGYVESINKGTGLPVRTCLTTVRTSHDIFDRLDLSKVDPQACLQVLNASISKSPTELAPVRPVLEFDMVDPRYIEEIDVLSGLDQRPNLMELTPNEFESLITNLFQKMGLETRQTQASRDGGVDCVAYDPRPIFGGKVVIQAKRYKNTVGVSAVRDLYGTLQNEGASKGILVTTSGYGKASFEFAEGKPIELLSGSNLLFLLAEHANVEAKIDIPENWKDPQYD